MTSSAAAPTAAGHTADRRGQWLALHVFYAANPQPLLVECVAPLIRELTAQNLLAGHFFINYWLEGPHVRLRLRPRTPADEPAVRAGAEAAVSRFLATRPALYAMGTGYLRELYDILFALEFPDGRPAELVDANGQMLLRPNNSYSYRPYEPEYGKYGGPAGIEVAEWHFQHSSDTVLRATSSMNLHLRPVVLGTAAQLMTVLAGTFLADREDLVDFLDRYHHYWHRAFAGTNLIGVDEYTRMYDSVAGELGRRVRRILTLVARGETQRLPGFLRGWAEHAVQLRRKVTALAASGELVVSAWSGGDRVITDPGEALASLLSPYLHMTNNRLQATIRDEAYLSYLLARVLRESAVSA
ncbi:lantibiotic dehydratase C-terminal domain-containing protein [Micromonospora sp. WMMA1363]|uniref:lantibiotic dehydratase C-terminal domain-containing protein n=1 Tax=Micromonospora sp. WMMA1363 TaxID=3053985 RepID=UPI00259D1DAA|nr:lantibiotic dehydratase C-terminal domain-containing protein [Micromonospora sp. WMMA1363]MDM4718722.1 lantibiotic dehydratase C-terminal domain-containing protein [Micromonospora sp. WMMA1363]